MLEANTNKVETFAEQTDETVAKSRSLIDKHTTHIIDNKLDWLLVYKDTDTGIVATGGFSRTNVFDFIKAMTDVSSKCLLGDMADDPMVKLSSDIGIHLTSLRNLLDKAPRDKAEIVKKLLLRDISNFNFDET